MKKKELMTKSIPNFMESTKLPNQEDGQTSNKISPKKSIPRHLIIKLQETSACFGSTYTKLQETKDKKTY